MPRSTQAAKVLLTILIAMCFVMVTIGGYVRMSGAGLSIPEWPFFTVAIEKLPDGTERAIKSVFPPTTDAGWEILRDIYAKDVPARGEGLAVSAFKTEFFIEWSHRLFAKLIGLVFLAFLAVVAFGDDVRSRIGKQALICGGLLVCQAVLGGLVVLWHNYDRHISIAVHLSTAFLFTCLLFWMLMSLIHPPAPAEERKGPNPLLVPVIAVFLLIYFQIFSGGLVAGSRAGYMFNEWPNMGDDIVPPGLMARGPSYLDNFFRNTVMIQFFHRWFAIGVAAAILLLIARSLTVQVSTPGRWALRALFATVVLQILLGITTLLTKVHPHVALTHQAIGLVLLLNMLLVVYEVTCHKVVGEQQQAKAAAAPAPSKEFLNA